VHHLVQLKLRLSLLLVKKVAEFFHILVVVVMTRLLRGALEGEHRGRG
jgi:hypothetical protein